MSKSQRALFAGLAALSLSIAGCASTNPRIPYTLAEAETADVPGMPADVRFYADLPGFVFDRFRQTVAAQAQARHEPLTFLALSSGGADGAFGAGFLKGLTEFASASPVHDRFRHQHRRPHGAFRVPGIAV